MSSMITVEEASRLIQEFAPKWGASSTSENLVSDRQYPPFHRVMMDGIAVNYDEHQKGLREFFVSDVCAAGEPHKELRDKKQCLEVMTGAPLPKNTDLVIPYEHLSIENGFAKVQLEIPRERNENIHLEGSDCHKSDIVLSAGSIINGPHAGIAASMGYAQIPLSKSPRIMIISTGDELVEVTQEPLPHQIRRSNAYALKTSLMINGFQDVTLDHLNDDPKMVAQHYEKYAHSFDLLIYSGGVSKGKFDYLPNVWTDMGVTKYFHEVSQRPGKPLWFGVDKNINTTIIGLPGNPVSSLVCLHRYIIPGRKVFVRLTEEIIFKKDLTYFLPVKIHFEKNGTIAAQPLKIKNSGEFTALAGSDGFIELPKDQSVFRLSESFVFYPWRHF